MLEKKNLSINFSEGLDLKTDPYQVQPGKFLELKNSVFSKAGLLGKRNGFAALTALPDTTTSYLTSFKGDLLAIGSTLRARESSTGTWITKGALQPLTLSVLPLIRNNLNQSQVDSAVSSNGLVCTAYTESDGSTTYYKFSVANSSTGQNVIAPTLLTPTSGTASGSPRVFVLGNFFVVVFTATITAANHLQYVAINTASLAVSQSVDITSSYTAASTVAFDGVVANNSLYLAWNGGSSSGIKMTYIDSTLTQHNTTNPDASHTATIVSVCADLTSATPAIYVSYYSSGTIYMLAVNAQLVVVPAFATPIFLTSGTIVNLTTSVQNGRGSLFFEKPNFYSFGGGTIASNYITGTEFFDYGAFSGSAPVVARSVGLASKCFMLNSYTYFLAAYSSIDQSTYFLINATTQIAAYVIAKIAYQNGGGYVTKGLASVSVNGRLAQVGYLFKDLIASVSNTAGPIVVAGSHTYSQTGINQASFTFRSSDAFSQTSNISDVEIGNNLHLSGGFLWMYDGYQPVEHNFFLYPDSVTGTWSNSGGSMAAQPDGVTNTNAYKYQVCYEWTDNQGNAFRSTPSPRVLTITTTGSGTSGSVTINVPTLRLTYKTANPVKIVVYRWSIAQQSYFQIAATSVSSPVLNSTTTDSVAIVDTAADATILGNTLIYTNGGVVEDVGAPSPTAMTLFDTRLWMIDAEDKNLLWYSKQVIEATPVEMSDLFTLYVAPSVSAQGPTGDLACLAPLDDKLILWKEINGIYYINGTGPDNTGTGSQYSQPTFITSTLGCSNQNSICFIPQGLMFQASDKKGIWLLGRDLSTKYIGAPVEDYNSYKVLSALTIPGTNQVRFTFSNNETVIYDYFFNQWNSFAGVPAVSSTLYQDLHSFINSSGQVFQESPGIYLDGSNPVLMSFKTSWFNLAGLQGYQRAYFFYLLGTYIGPHKLLIEVAYDYDPSPSQSLIISPTNFSPPWGGDASWGSGKFWGGPGRLEPWKVNLKRQTCQALQIRVTEIFDSFFQTTAGAGFTLSGINLVLGLKKAYRPLKASATVG